MINILISILFLLSPVYPHTEADTQMLADVMWLENGSTGKTEAENRECLILTGAVVLNRMESGEWGGKTIKKVIYAKGQYASSTKKRIGNADTPEWVVELAEQMLTYGTNVPKYVIYQSMQPKLGTHWKKIDGEYFATNGGHKNEGYDMVAEVNGYNGWDLRTFVNVFRNTDLGRAVGTNQIKRWWRNATDIGSKLVSLNILGGGNFHS